MSCSRREKSESKRSRATQAALSGELHSQAFKRVADAVRPHESLVEVEPLEVTPRRHGREAEGSMRWMPESPPNRVLVPKLQLRLFGARSERRLGRALVGNDTAVCSSQLEVAGGVGPDQSLEPSERIQRQRFARRTRHHRSEESEYAANVRVAHPGHRRKIRRTPYRDKGRTPTTLTVTTYERGGRV